MLAAAVCSTVPRRAFSIRDISSASPISAAAGAGSPSRDPLPAAVANRFRKRTFRDVQGVWIAPHVLDPDDVRASAVDEIPARWAVNAAARTARGGCNRLPTAAWLGALCDIARD